MNANDNLSALRSAVDADRRRLCDALGLKADGSRYFCPKCQSDGAAHKTGDFSIEAGFRCHKCGYSADGFGLVQEVKRCGFPEALAFVREVYGVAAPMPAKCAERGAGGMTLHKTPDDAAKACAWGVSKRAGKDWQATRQDMYRTAEGVEIGLVIRLEPADGELDAEGKKVKTFRPYHKEMNGWESGDPSGLWPLFKLPEIVASTGLVFICEGEKAASAGATIGLTCTASAHGAKSPTKTCWGPLQGRDVVVLPDNDAAGREYAEAVAQLCFDAGVKSFKIVGLPGLPPKGDLVEFIGAGGTADDVRRLVEASRPWTPPAPVERVAVEPTKPEPTGATGGVEAIRAALWDLTQEKIPANEFYRKAASAVVDWLHGRGRFYFHAERPDFAGVMFFDDERKLLLPVGSDAFLAWLADCLGVNRSERVFQFAASAVETEGLSTRSTGIMPAAYWAGRLNGDAPAIYISAGPGQMAKITAKAVEIVDNGTDDVLFPAGAVLEPWHLVEDGRDPFESCSIFKDMATAAPHGRELVRLWTMSLFADFACKPPLCVSSPVGGGKTALVRGVFRLLGIVENITAVNKNGEGDFWATLDGGGLACFDNADTRIDWLPDALAAASTAGSHQKRKLYTDADRVTLRARAAVAITSASPSFASDAGLADRLLVVRLQRRTGETAESTLFNEVTAARNAGLSWIARVLSVALADAAPTPGRLNARHPDFASFAVRIGRAMGREAEAVEALKAAERDKSLFNLENDSVGAVLLETMQTGGRFIGTASELLARMQEVDPSLDGTLSQKRLGKRLEKLWPHLEATFKAKRERDGHCKQWLYVFNTPESFAGFAGFETAFQQKSLVKENVGTLPKTSIETPQTPQTPPPTLFDAVQKPAEHPVEVEVEHPVEDEPAATMLERSAPEPFHGRDPLDEPREDGDENAENFLHP